MQIDIFDRTVVQKALEKTGELDKNQGFTTDAPADNHSSVISLLIYDIFGGEILKTHKKRGWHFYNRINGKVIDFTRAEKGKTSGTAHLEDIPSTPDEIHNYFDKEDYSTFFMRFIRAFEETVGLRKYQPNIT
jgi:hypothetical protein